MYRESNHATVMIAQSCSCGAHQSVVFPASVCVQLANGTGVPIARAPDLADVWRLVA
jgi:hypothetical protein